MRACRSAVVSSALLFILGPMGAHPVLDATASDASEGCPLEPLLIAEFYPCAASGDEYLVLYNRGPGTVNLTGWWLTDGEGCVVFASGEVPGGERLSISEDASSFESAYGTPPDVHVPGWSGGDSVCVSGRFRLADAGDCVELLSPDGLSRDCVVYGDASPPSVGWTGLPVPALRTGEVVERILSPDCVDTDSASDWMHFREARYGHTDHGIASSVVPAGNLTMFVSPDCSFDVVSRELAHALSSIRLCSYELSSSAVCRLLAYAASRGVDVSVLVDADPVGGMSASQVACLSAIARDGVDVRAVGGDLEAGVVRHFGALHSKYVVVDELTLVALSENFVEDGVPVDRLFGNRGWGVSITDPAVACFMSSVFDDDSRLGRHDVWRWRDDERFDPGASLPVAAESRHESGVLAPLANAREARVSVYLSPDVSVGGPFLVDLVTGSDRVSVEQFQVEMSWTIRWSGEPVMNPLADAVVQVLASGGAAEGLFDDSWYNHDANTEAVECLSAAAVAAGGTPSFALLPAGSPVTTMHNKGLVLDGSVVVSSNNWVYASFARNRELAVVVTGPDAVSYFTRAFALDRVPDTVPPVADAGDDVHVNGPCTVILDASGSWDDRAVADVLWDTDGDGRTDAEGPTVEIEVDGPGLRTAWVVVLDAWGNSASDSVDISCGPSGVPGNWWSWTVPAVPWPLPAAMAFLFFAVRTARKLNLSRASMRPKG